MSPRWVLVVVLATGCSGGSLVLPRDPRRAVVEDALKLAAKGEPWDPAWVGGVATVRLYAVKEWSLVADKPLPEVLKEYSAGLQEERDRQASLVPSIDYAEIKHMSTEALDAYVATSEAAKKVVAEYDRVLAVARSTGGRSYRVRVSSTTQGGQPIEKFWLFTVMDTAGGPKLSHVLDENERLDMDGRSATILAMAGQR